MGLNRLVVIAGPTGTGKSRLALAVASATDGEVVNADSMQLYRGMDIGTAKLSPTEREGVPHHLLDVLDVTQTASVAAYQRDARAAVESILAHGRTPLLVGGSGLYVQAVNDEIDFPGTDPVVRARLVDELDREGVAALRARLAAVDPAAAATIEPNDGRRLVRALEVVEITGRPFTAALPRPGPARYDAVVIHLDRETSHLDSDLAVRVRRMVATGFLAEVRALDGVGLRGGKTAAKALGYRQMLDVLDGVASLEDAIEETIVATRRFVRRQRSWFGRDSRAVRLDGEEDVRASTAAVVEMAHSSSGRP